MRITQEQLHSRACDIERVEIRSIEGQLYMVTIYTGGDPRGLVLSDNDRKTRLFRSAWQAKDAFTGILVATFEMVHDSAYDEMIGLPQSGAQPMRMPLGDSAP